MSDFVFSDRSYNRRKGIDQRFIDISDLALDISVVDFGIPEYGGIRTAEEQNKLFCEGKSKCDGFNDIGDHQLKLALDVYAYVDGKASWKKEHLAMVAVAMFKAANMLEYKLDWGGLWEDYPDFPHYKILD